jgi:hypothetical protein
MECNEIKSENKQKESKYFCDTCLQILDIKENLAIGSNCDKCEVLSDEKKQKIKVWTERLQIMPN